MKFRHKNIDKRLKQNRELVKVTRQPEVGSDHYFLKIKVENKVAETRE